MINLASVRDVERQMPKNAGAPRLSAARFRANLISLFSIAHLVIHSNILVVTGPEAYLEESWRRIKIGFYEYDVSARCARCKMPNVDQVTGEKHATEPDNTMRSFRAVDEGTGPNIGCLGMQMVPLSKDSALRVGDEIIVLESGEHNYIKQ